MARLCQVGTMRTGQLRALLRELRAGGVSEYQCPDGKGTVVIKLGGFSPRLSEPSTSMRIAPAKAAAQVDAEDRRLREQTLAELGVTEQQAAEVLARVS